MRTYLRVEHLVSGGDWKKLVSQTTLHCSGLRGIVAPGKDDTDALARTGSEMLLAGAQVANLSRHRK